MVSVILPVLNGANTIEKSIESVRNQSYSDLELIVVDNGSIDGTIEICERYINMDTRIRFLHSLRPGVVAGRKTGMDASNGEYIAFIDADDQYVPEMLETMVKALEQNDLDIISCGYTCFDENEIETLCIPDNTGVIGENAFFERLFINGTLGFLWNKVYRRNVAFEMLHPDGMVVCEDLFMNCSLLMKPRRIQVLAQSLYRYYLNSNSVTHTISKKIDAEGHWKYLTAYQRLYDLFQGDVNKQNVIKQSTLFVIKLGVEELFEISGYNGTKKELLVELCKAIFTNRYGKLSIKMRLSCFKTYLLGQLKYLKNRRVES